MCVKTEKRSLIVRRMMKIFVRRFDGKYAKRMFLMKKEREEKNE